MNADGMRSLIGLLFLSVGIFLASYSLLDIYYNRPDLPAPIWGYGIVSAIVGLVLLRRSISYRK